MCVEIVLKRRLAFGLQELGPGFRSKTMPQAFLQEPKDCIRLHDLIIPHRVLECVNVIFGVVCVRLC